jgi:hypothetical protein
MALLRSIPIYNSGRRTAALPRSSLLTNLWLSILRIVDTVSISSSVHTVRNERQAIEIFHLLFLWAFGARVDNASSRSKVDATCASSSRASATRKAWISISNDVRRYAPQQLFHHGLIERIQSVVYAFTPARPRRLRSPSGTMSFLFDLFYFAP